MKGIKYIYICVYIRKKVYSFHPYALTVRGVEILGTK